MKNLLFLYPPELIYVEYYAHSCACTMGAFLCFGGRRDYLVHSDLVCTTFVISKKRAFREVRASSLSDLLGLGQPQRT